LHSHGQNSKGIVNHTFSIEGVSWTELFLLISAWPNDDVVELPGVHSQIPLWLTILVDGELGRRKEHAVALVLVLIVDPFSPAIRLKDFDWVLQ
jgi:hypothetical protein